jgi:hypothetical protein
MSDPQWYRDLDAGQGAAAGIDPKLRAALISTTREVADEQAERARQDKIARQEADRESQQQVKREAAQERMKRGRAIVSASFRLLPMRLIVAAILVGLTPVGASFATISPVGANITNVVFFPGETGSTAGSGPFTLYAILFWIVLGTLATTFTIDLLFGPPRGASFSWPAILGALVGVAIFIALWAGDSLSGASWAIPPIGLAAAYLLSALISGARYHPMPRTPTGRELANR